MLGPFPFGSNIWTRHNKINPGAPMDYQHIRADLADHILTLTLNRPDRLNAFTLRMKDELVQAFGEADRE